MLVISAYSAVTDIKFNLAAFMGTRRIFRMRGHCGAEMRKVRNRGAEGVGSREGFCPLSGVASGKEAAPPLQKNVEFFCVKITYL